MNKNLLKYIVGTVALIAVMVGALFKSEIVFSMEREQGCGDLKTLAAESTPSIEEYGGPHIAEAVVSEGASFAVNSSEPEKVGTINCLDNSQCEIWKKPYKIPVSITLVTSGPSFELLQAHNFFTGTSLDEEQSYFAALGVKGFVVGVEKGEPICTKEMVKEVSRHLDWRWK